MNRVEHIRVACFVQNRVDQLGISAFRESRLRFGKSICHIFRKNIKLTSFHSTVNLLCGIGLFLLGISLMGEHTEKAFGEGLSRTLGILTKNRFTGMLTGLAVTGIIQSSSATTVMAVSFVSAGIMTLSQAVGIVMGANIGTTVTSLLIAFNFSSLAPLAIFFGVAVKLFCKKERTSSSEIISKEDAMFETMMLGLRMNEGVSLARFEKLHGQSGLRKCTAFPCKRYTAKSCKSPCRKSWCNGKTDM